MGDDYVDAKLDGGYTPGAGGWWKEGNANVYKLNDYMTVYSKDDISVTFKNGTEIHIG